MMILQSRRVARDLYRLERGYRTDERGENEGKSRPIGPLETRDPAPSLRSGFGISEKSLLTAVAALLLAACGCRSHVIHVRLTNTSSQTVSVVIVDYPKATFGVNSLAPGRAFQYTIKPTESGPVKVQFLDTRGTNHSFSGPTIQKGQEGNIEIKITQESAAIETALH
jgi:hypothetical protein